ncbi:MAG: acyltransferase family protein [Lachnospiraceae bacterium]|nr:acyltransferase family protein [Lachnospiraceae bacterium]
MDMMKTQIENNLKVLKERVYYLDFIRVIATFLIILYHFLAGVESYGLLQNPDAFKIGNISLLNLGGVNLTLGNYAVSLFFIISGAGLMYVYQEKLELKQFFRKRTEAIYPLYYIAFTAVFLLRLILTQKLEHGIPAWTYLLTLLGIDGWLLEVIPNYALVGDWFVGCILCIYLLFPLFRKFLNKNPHLTVVLYGLVFLIWERFYPINFAKRNDVILRAFEVLLGMYFIKINKKVTWKGVLVSLLLLGTVFAVKIPWISLYVLVPIAGMSLFLVLNYISGWFKGEKIKKAVSFFSFYSFPVFLVHHYLLNTIMEMLPKGCLGIAGMLFLFVLCLIVIWAAGAGIKKLELGLRKADGYERVYAAYVCKILLAVSVVIYLGRFVYLACTQVPSFDGSMNLQVPVSLARDGLYATNYGGLFPFARRIQTGAPVLFLIALMFKVFGIGSVQALLINVFYIALMAFFFIQISKELDANKAAVVWFLGLTILIWHFMELSMGIYGEIPALALFLGCIYFLMLAQKKEKAGYFAAAGLFFGLAYLTKTVILIAVPALIVVFASKWLVEKKMKFRDILLWILGAAVPVIVFEIYKLIELGFSHYLVYWSGQSDNILRQAGVKAGYEDTPNLIEKVGIHLTAFTDTFGIPAAVLMVLLILNFAWFVFRAVKRKRLEFVDIIELVVYSYFGWWLLITPTEKAWGRRIIIGLLLLEWLSCIKGFYIFDWLVEKGKLSISRSAKAIAETVICGFAIIFVSFGMQVYNGDAKKGAVELAQVVQQKARDEQAVICGNGWWQAPTISFYSGVDFADLSELDLSKTDTPVYFVADTNWIENSGESEEDLPYPVEMIYEESVTGQRLYLVHE